ncbi:SRPBCC family protein [Microbacterium sp. NPDC028030]|uniref:SRPBCC family protein n=1 Tax=Microbacterium sp. NPDC028030 TaxID=3155124 RepID=UPI0033F9CC95
MTSNTREMACTTDDVFRVLANGWLYPAWVVGASRMRDVDESWPAAGSQLHHSVGVWPALLDDTTEVLEWDPPRGIMLRARGWPMGEAQVTLRARTTPTGCQVRIDEEPVKGPAALIPRLFTAPMLRWRNAETLHRLAYLAEGHAESS